MNRVYSLVICLLFFCTSTINAQTYSSDAVLISKIGNTATIRCSGVDSKKKVAVEMAIKSAIYTYLYSGIEGLNDGKPLLGRNPSAIANEYVKNMLNGGKYSVFVKNHVVDEKASKNIGKIYQAIVTVEIFDASIYKDLVNNRIIGQLAGNTSISDTQDQIALPTIMVVPYCKDGEDIISKMDDNPDMKTAIAKVTEGFISKGVKTRNVRQAIIDAGTNQAMKGGMSNNDMLINNSGADVMVSVDIMKDTKPEGIKITLILQAVEIATKGDLASKTEVSGRKNASPNDICKSLVDVLIDDFLKQISTNMAHKISRGNSISIRFSFDPNSAFNMDSEVGNEFLPLSDAIVIWVRQNAKNGKYHQKGRSETLMELDEIFIDNKSESGVDMNINDFSLKLYQYLRGLNLTIKRTVVGDTIDIIIM